MLSRCAKQRNTDSTLVAHPVNAAGNLTPVRGVVAGQLDTR